MPGCACPTIDDAAPIRAQIAELETAASQVTAGIASGQKRLREIEDALGDLHRLLNRIAPPPSEAECVQAYLRRQQEHRAGAVAAAESVAAAVRGTGIDPAEVLARGRSLADAVRAHRA